MPGISMRKRIKNLNPQLKPLCEGCIDLPSERLPEPNWINVTKEEYDRMFEPMKQDDLLDKYKEISDKFDEFTQCIRKTVPVNSLPPHCRMGLDPPGTHVCVKLQPPSKGVSVSGECEKCGYHTLECQCKNFIKADMGNGVSPSNDYIDLNKIIPAAMIERIEDIGRAQEKLKGILDDEIFDNLSKHDTYWKSKYEPESEKLDDLRRKIAYINERLSDLWDILRKEE